MFPDFAMLTAAHKAGIAELPPVVFFKLGNGGGRGDPNGSAGVVKEWQATLGPSLLLNNGNVIGGRGYIIFQPAAIDH